MFETLKNAFKVKEIRIKIWMTLLFVLIYRIGCYIPVPGVGTGVFASELSQVSYLNIMSMMTGGSLENGTWFAMGIGPYINASIIIQLLTVAIPALERLSKQGEEGQKKIAKYTRYGALILAIIQAIGILVSYNSLITASTSSTALSEMLGGQTWLAYVIVVLFYASGALVTVAVQSSAATTVMTVSFVNAGLLTLVQAIPVIMGANIGTTVTAWIMSVFGFQFNMSSFVWPFFGLRNR